MQDRLLETAVAAFAVWTIASHATVAIGGTLRTLQLLFLFFGAAALIGLYQLRHRWAVRAAPVATLSEGTSERRAWLRPIYLVLAWIAILGVSWSPASREYLWWWVAPPLLFAVVAYFGFEDRERPRPKPPLVGGWTNALPWALALVSVVLALVAHRYDTDDAIYVNLAVSAVDYPSQPILTYDDVHGIEGLPLNVFLYKVHSFEMLGATLSELTGLPAIAAFHWILAACAALLLPLVWAQLCRLLTPRTWPWTLLVILLVLIVVGAPHRWPGNFAWVRIWQGKSIFISILMPLLYAWSLRFCLRPSLRGWLRLAAAQIAMIGLTSSAITLGPIVVMTGAVAAIGSLFRRWKTLLAVTATSFYPVGLGLLLLALPNAAVRGLQPRNEHPPGTWFRPSEATVIADEFLPIAVAALLLAWTVSRSRLLIRFALGVPAVVWLVLMNPYAENLMTRFVVGGVYWRLFWLLPIPLLIGVALTAPRRWRATRGGILATFALVAFFILASPVPHGLGEGNRVTLHAVPKLKVQRHTYPWAVELVENVPPRSLVAAPTMVSQWLPTFHNHPYPLLIEHHMARRLVGREEVRERRFLTHYVDGATKSSGGRAERFRDGLERFDIRGVCLRVLRNDNVEEARGVLQESGYLRGRGDESFEIWTR